MEQRGLASANFEEQDAGSGPVYSSPSLGPVVAAVHNINARHLHDIGTALPDDRQFLRTWRRQLQECLNSQNSRVIKFLLADVSGEDDVSRRCLEVLNKYSKSTWNFASSTRDLALSVDISKSMAEITEGLGGITPSELRSAQKKAIRLYVAAATATCAAETRLEEKLKRLEVITAKINDMMFMEPTAELESLAGPTRVYLDSVLEKLDIETDYKDLIENYKKFAALKGLVSLQNLQRSAAPTCTICMTKEVSQVVAPCGHTFCEDCCKNQMTACYICRVQIRDRMRLYFS
jgi:hypothetical protein